MNTSATRIGSVPYLNAAPLVYALEPEPRLLVPARLAPALYAGELDAALVPIAEYLVHAESYKLVEGAAVSARGEVTSVFLIPDRADRKISEVRRVALDPDSRTSVLLTRVLLEIGQGLAVEYVTPGAEAEARLLIGDPALAFRRQNREYPVFDLGKLWFEWTGLPFVFAGWAVRREMATAELGDRLRGVKAAGLAARSRIAATAEELRYITEFIRYDLGTEEKAGIVKFAHYLVQLGVLAKAPELEFI